MKKFYNKLVIWLCSISLFFMGACSYQRESKNKVIIEEKDSTQLENPIEEKKEPIIHEASLFMVGDALIHGAIYVGAQLLGNGQYDFHPMLKRMANIAKGYDLAYYNRETIIGGDERGASTFPLFNTPTAFGDAMVDAGFNIVSTATNHSLDATSLGARHAKAYWKEKGIVEDGINLSFEEQEEIHVHEVNGISYAFFSYTYGMNGLQPPSDEEYLINCYTGQEERVYERIRKAKEMCDVVIIAMH
ncbi:MAG: CapA family protein, partial [Solobacterium sp.]|nr:CapA family protein [Solobacterium sp.]